MALKLRRGTNAGRTAITPAEGEPIYTTDTKQLFVGDGSTAGGISIGGVSDGDKGDITVSGTGATWTIDNDAVTYAKIQNVSATSRLLGRASSGSGDIEEITIGSGLSLSGTTISASGGTGSPTAVIYKTADETVTSSSTLQDDNDFTYSLVSGKRYWIRLQILQSRTNTNDTPFARFAIDGNSFGFWRRQNSSNFVNTNLTQDDTGPATAGNANQAYPIVIEIALNATSNYTFKVQWAQWTSSSTGVTFQKGSQMIVWEY